MSDNARTVCCFCCDGEGRITYREPGYRIRPWGPETMEREERCDTCDGTGGMIIETLPIELEDLDAVAPPTANAERAQRLYNLGLARGSVSNSAALYALQRFYEDMP